MWQSYKKVGRNEPNCKKKYIIASLLAIKSFLNAVIQTNIHHGTPGHHLRHQCHTPSRHSRHLCLQRHIGHKADSLSHTMSKYKDTCTAMFLSPRAKSFIAHWHSYGRRNAGSAIIRFQGSSRMAAHGACVC